jgi:mRNA interferase MazF
MSLTLQEQLAKIKTIIIKENNSNYINQYKAIKHSDNKEKNIHSNINSEVAMSKINYSVEKVNIENLQWGDVLYVDLDQNGVGSEQRGIRYAIVIQNDIGNKHSPTVIVAFVTSQITKAKLPLIHVEIPAGNFGLPKDSVVLLEQLRTLDKRRIIKRVGRLDEITSLKIERALKMSTKRKLEKKLLIERLPEEMTSDIVNKIKFIETCKQSIEFLKSIKGDKYSINLAEDEKFKEENSLKYYCYKNNINYKEIYNNYLELEKRKEEGIAL